MNDTRKFVPEGGRVTVIQVVDGDPTDLTRRIAGEVDDNEIVFCACDGTSIAVRDCLKKRSLAGLEDTRRNPTAGRAMHVGIVTSCAGAGLKRVQDLMGRVVVDNDPTA